MIDFNLIVKKRMEQKGMNGYDLADRMGYAPASVYRILRGERKWTQKTITLACEALNLKVEVKPTDGQDLQAG